MKVCLESFEADTLRMLDEYKEPWADMVIGLGRPWSYRYIHRLRTGKLASIPTHRCVELRYFLERGKRKPSC
mgnify:FL=1|jgi:hypothetical protein